MEKDKIKYLIAHFLYLVPSEVKSKLKYPYLKEYEIETEEIKIAELILKDFKDMVFINNCSKCGRLARTPKAKQCRHCGHDWH